MRFYTALLLIFTVVAPALSQSQVFALTPLPDRIDRVNGMTFGLGYMWSKGGDIKVNGFNLEINPATFLVPMIDPSKVSNDAITIEFNGLHVAFGGFMGEVEHNGLGLSVFNITYATNGLSISGLYNVSRYQNGLFVSALSNSSDKANGLLIAAVNSADIFNGLQIGLYNKSQTMTGLQIGLFNKTEKTRGLQIGLWNINGKRSLPFLNW